MDRIRSERLLQRLHRRVSLGLSKGAKDERGAVAVMFAAAVLLLVPLVMGVLEIYIASEQRGKAQDALDAATLFAARSTASTNTAIDAIGDGALNANLTLLTGAELKSADFTLVNRTVKGVAVIKPPALAPLMWSHPEITVTSEVMRSEDKLEIALVLDTTGSMQGQKLTTLKTAGKNLVDKLTAAAAGSTVTDPIKIALVPFSNTVRATAPVDLTLYNNTTHTGPTVPTWVDPLGKAHQVSGTNYDNFDAADQDRLTFIRGLRRGSNTVANYLKWDGCVEMRRAPYDVQNDAPSSGTPATMYVPYFWPDEADTRSGYSGSYNDYLGDVSTSSDNKVRQRYRLKYPQAAAAQGGVNLKATGTFTLDSTAYGGPYNFGPNAGCVKQEVIRLTTSMSTIKTGIDNMEAMGETNIPIGLAWGWNALSPTGPYADGQAYTTQKLKKIVILMTDGENTMNDPSKSGEPNGSFYHGYGYIWQNLLGIVSGTSSARTSKIDSRLALLCQNMKAKGIILYTVRVEVTSGTSDLLKGCASGDDKFFDVQDVSQLSNAFDAIAHSIHNLRITR